MKVKIERVGLLMGVTIAGIALLIAGVVSSEMLSTAIGGALLGACLTGWISKADLLRIENNTFSVLRNSLNAKFLSEEEKIVNFRKKWHLFHLTEIEKENIWRHRILDFSHLTSVGGLLARSTTIHPNGDEVVYTIEGGFRDQRLIIFSKVQGSDEPVGVYIFPLFGESFHTVHHGIGFIKTWAGNNALIPAIISNRTLFEISERNGVNAEEAKKLDDLWKKEIYRLHNVFPTVHA